MDGIVVSNASSVRVSGEAIVVAVAAIMVVGGGGERTASEDRRALPQFILLFLILVRCSIRSLLQMIAAAMVAEAVTSAGQTILAPHAVVLSAIAIIAVIAAAAQTAAEIAIAQVLQAVEPSPQQAVGRGDGQGNSQ